MWAGFIFCTTLYFMPCIPLFLSSMYLTPFLNRFLLYFTNNSLKRSLGKPEKSKNLLPAFSYCQFCRLSFLTGNCPKQPALKSGKVCLFSAQVLHTPIYIAFPSYQNAIRKPENNPVPIISLVYSWQHD